MRFRRNALAAKSRQRRPQLQLGLALAVGLLVAFGSAAPASGFYDNGIDSAPGAFLASADYNRLEQGDDTTKFAAISGDGRYVAIETFSRNLFGDEDPDPEGQYRAGGVFRFDLQTRALEKVADGNLFKDGDNSFLRRGASNPSISADGRFVAFATAQQLVAADDNENVDVYVRDMAIALPPGSSGACTAAAEPPCPYQLVSARDGGDEPPQYGPPQFPFPGSNPGSDLSRGVAISADGRRVVFRTEAPSNLPAAATDDVPAGQVFVRDLVTKTTTLVTRNRNAETGQMTGAPAGGALGAAISADGATVAWTGANAPAQTRFLSGENTDPGFLYFLWRRAPFGPDDPTRRITGLSDPDDPTCRHLEEENPAMITHFDQISTGPCYGPLTDQEGNLSGISAQLPVLSGNGFKVAFLTGAGPRPTATSGTGLDLFVTDMTPGLSRKQATVELTRDPATFDAATSSPLTSLAMSSDGHWLALTTVRTQFSLPALQLAGAPRSVPNVQELYMVDLQAHTIERVTHGYNGSDINGDVQSGTSLSADGARVAFTSFAGNLFFGDANQRPDAFVATREPEPTPDGSAAAGKGGQSSVERFGGPHISARLRSVRGGVAVLGVKVPAAGHLDAVASAGDRGHKASKVAEGEATARRKGTVSLTMRLRARARASLREEGKLRTRVKVSFAPASGGRRLHTSLRVAFVSKSSPAHK